MDTRIKHINKNEILKYLEYRGSEIPHDINLKIDELMEEIRRISQPKYYLTKFNILSTDEGI